MEFSLNKRPWHVQIGAFVGLSIGALAVFYFFYVSPAQDEIAGRQRQLAGLRADINRGLATAQQLPQVRKDAEALGRRLDTLRTVLLEEKDVAELLRRIQTLATQSSLTITGFKPAPIAIRQLHAEWPITLELDGTYHSLGLFFDRISTFSRIINISGVEIRAKERPLSSSTITAVCVATTFVLLDAKSPAAAVKVAQ